MVLFTLVASHRNVDLNTVARLSTGIDALPHALVTHGPLEGLVTLSTCNRLELYAEAPSRPGAVEDCVEALVAKISRSAGLDAGFVADSLELHREEDAAAHLFTVVSGLESAVVGEREITGQVRRALIDAQGASAASGELIRLFESAARTARAVGTQTSLGERGRSIVSVALDLAEDVSPTRWDGARALVFGTGAYAGATMAALAERGCADVLVYSGSGRAREFTDKRGGAPVEREDLREAMSGADIIIGCSGGSAPIAAAALPEGPRVVVDLALTRDFDPSVADLDGVELITLESVRLAAPEETVESVEAARRIVDRAAADFATHRSERSVDTAIVALRRHTMAILDSEMEKVRGQYGCGAQSDQLEFAMRRMMHSLLHTPMVKARKLAAAGREDEFFSAIEALYDLEVEPEERPADRRPGVAAADQGRDAAAAGRGTGPDAAAAGRGAGPDAALPPRGLPSDYPSAQIPGPGIDDELCRRPRAS
ncbi:glutamyl-tRNA reductase [Rothia sp. AR01]|uniref:Glutamyl-tRNA reductase n=1 Tax=Rothia santali TaxID=2949643 RepID=A0A9X2HD40_9MICC|nr:glutamyl-tRNA reductase [Rothia santali]MCP3426075.1 glutamyl-tRNA reductase [Rothia santali]